MNQPTLGPGPNPGPFPSPRKRGAPKGNQNARKPTGPRDDILHIRCRKTDKEKWLWAAKDRPLATWVQMALNRAVEMRL